MARARVSAGYRGPGLTFPEQHIVAFGGLDGHQGTRHFLQHVWPRLSNGRSGARRSQGSSRGRGFAFPGCGAYGRRSLGEIGRQSGARGVCACSGGDDGLTCGAACGDLWNTDEVRKHGCADAVFSGSDWWLVGQRYADREDRQRLRQRLRSTVGRKPLPPVFTPRCCITE